MTAQEAQWLNQIIATEELHVLFQPIVDASQQAIYGYEALIRGPKSSPLHSPLRLFDVATKRGCWWSWTYSAVVWPSIDLQSWSYPACCFLTSCR
ncbi:hypothetical protein HSBAA_04560 [Vreelandella sulfidaeris]|uniref:EAL domain-containing protein n=1 Tax=Vreelandella sulfidaeris TaxID=115553 RepID=A0A455TZY7_9GAMM|nr:hypothetical protein HSBAA_04560 [Halomonas sulfidaeris]